MKAYHADEGGHEDFNRTLAMMHGHFTGGSTCNPPLMFLGVVAFREPTTEGLPTNGATPAMSIIYRMNFAIL